MKIAIVGGRNFNDYNFLKQEVDKFIELSNIVGYIELIVSGGAAGADRLAAKYAAENYIELMEIIPNWSKYGKSAGYLRNIEIVNNSDIIIAFWDGKSKGTKHTIDVASDYFDKIVKIIRYDERR